MSSKPFARGGLIAVAAAVLFGLTTPLVRYFGEHVGAFATAALLYAGATLGAGIPRRRADEPSLSSAELPRLTLVALLGAALAPASLAWGLQRVGALTGSLLLNLEAVFTLLLAWGVYREQVGRRAALAIGLMIAGGAVLALRAGSVTHSSLLGVAAVAAATFAWALDNTLTRPLADFDPRAVVFWKAGIGCALSALVAFSANEALPSAFAALALLACGATGYGLSLRLYLLAQRAIGAARTGSLFAIGPFVGASTAFVLGDRASTGLVLTSAACFAVAVYVHLTESHGHAHRHEAMEHEHAHSHDDGHHDHRHEPPIAGVHSHAHRHEPTEHDHPHGVDLHHDHEHD